MKFAYLIRDGIFITVLWLWALLHKIGLNLKIFGFELTGIVHKCLQVTANMCVMVEECWDHDPEARLSAECIDQRLAMLQ